MNFEHEQASCVEAIHNLKSVMIVLMETAFKADFSRRIPVVLALVKDKLATIQNQLEFTSSRIDNRITTLEEQVAHLKTECTETASLLAAYVDRLEHMDNSYAALNQTVSDFSLSLHAFIDDAKKRKDIARDQAKIKATEKTRFEEEEKTTKEAVVELVQVLAKEVEAAEKAEAAERRTKKAGDPAKKKMLKHHKA